MSLKISVKKSLEYAQKYGSVLTLSQLEERLIGSKRRSHAEIMKVASTFGIKSGKGINKISKKKIRKARQFVKKILDNYEDVLMVGITGSVAAGSAKENDDIDLLIITKKQRLWVVRLMLKIELIRRRIPHRRWNGKEVGDEYCLNLWLDEANLKIPKDKRNIRNAMDLVMMRPILNKNDLYEKFMKKNIWVGKYVNTGYSNKMKRLIKTKYIDSKTEARKPDWLNFFCYMGQRMFMLPKIKKERVSLGSAFFHPDG
ncbi:hypothetical protein A2574_00545 [Candidatus Shapirobacteria bacterium RIFOXYD1_FULL_38_32]|uniref:Polymerase beta nucleotidyltransferase domain-containing protein n=2 Tax=Candidatus Shapironibacteriota TaxID=1752721 RepID=A0A0G0MDB1_9BACT|nr:MAG: hypothetical protein US90_C0001G0049 [Candidatus Shapirobacteria bacterium GW2011_GWE2_38_30]KKQ91165.1 MAG: hypothetical protein UT14_C0021G0005 [Candidatus Shapirobacteria bacterium GW2011_GWE1_38_92]OGL56449.1 MAG: hypothetical protein A2195_03425 [Candidatus Shapirobacteria bacterium RIFOXYA1_FULL_39_17]OGL56886.1 MAG: hypothetical protein A2410_00435 [Candidatus Shapirobacteria bacterium RIFOXYC1_FULL_38_24]OGL58306.1 MAG: hypothetical protein A2574_00545 [Candidatus Shapirobacteri